MSEWNRTKLGELAKITTGFPFDGHKYAAEGVRVVRGENVTIGSLRWDTDKRWNEPFDRSVEFELKQGDIVIGMDGSRVGRNRAVIKQEDLPLLLAQRVACVRAKDTACQRYLYFAIFSKEFERFVDSVVTGSAIPHISMSQIADYELPSPPIAVQKRIAAVLSSLDDKIENNRKICKNLEEQAQAIFKSWFVDFEPFGGEMPSEWNRAILSDIAEYDIRRIHKKDLTIKTYFSTENMLPDRGGVEAASSLPETDEVPRCDAGAVLVSNIRPYFKKIHLTSETGGHSADVLCFVAKDPEMKWYLYRLLWDDTFFAYVMSGAKGCKMPRGDKEQIMEYGCVTPDTVAITKFNAVIEPMCRKIAQCENESCALAELRDALLPKLMSGEIDVDKVEV